VGLLTEAIAGLPLVDAHCHALPDAPVDARTFGVWLTEADRFPTGVDPWDTAVGFAVRRWCAPVLGLPPDLSPDEYLEARAAMGIDDVARRLMGAARLSWLLIDTGYPEGAEPAVTADAAGAQWREVVRLESVAQRVAASGVGPGGFAAAFVEELASAAQNAVAVKSILAYRHGFDIDPTRPADREVTEAAGEWLERRDPGRGPRLDHPVLLRFVLWSGLDLGLPLQVHAGFGDRDLDLARSDAALLQPFLAATEPAGVPIVLLHCYPYHRQAAWLAHVYPHVYVDVGLTVGQVGARADSVLAEFCELAPFGKLLFSTDGCRLPELYLVGAAQFRHSFGRLLEHWVGDGAVPAADAERVARLVAGDNARRVYGLAGT
jgi:predicted TIM-barrel fold metal-dependent hydrolase